MCCGRSGFRRGPRRSGALWRGRGRCRARTSPRSSCRSGRRCVGSPQAGRRCRCPRPQGARAPFWRAVFTEISPPSGVYLMALSRRMLTACSRRSGSKLASTGSAEGTWLMQCVSPAESLAASTAPAATASRSCSPGFKGAPSSPFARESRSSTRLPHAAGFRVDRVRALPRGPGVRRTPLLQHARVALYRGEGGPQLVACVGDEAALVGERLLAAGERGLQAGEQVVHGRRQKAHLVFRVLDGDPLR